MRVGKGGTLLAAASLSVTGCAGGGAGPLGIGAIVGDRNLAAAEPLFAKNEQDCLGSADMLISVLYATSNADVFNLKTKKSAKPCERMWTNFGNLLPQPPANGVRPQYTAEQRNEIIDVLLASSNRKCTRYASLLKNADGAMNAGLSVGAILTGGLGSILPGAGAARALAGSSSILSGSRAALNDTYLSNQTIHVLTAAFEKARRAQRRTITNRQACTVEQYTLARGIEDAFAYHDSCSLVAGLAETALSIERSENPGLDAMRMQLNELTNLRRQMTEFTEAGPISPIARTAAPPSLVKLIAADKALTAAATAETAAKDEFDKAAAAEVTAKAKPDDKAALDAATKALAAAKTAYLKAVSAREAADRANFAEIQALVRQTVPVAQAVEPETRVCPFDVGGTRVGA